MSERAGPRCALSVVVPTFRGAANLPELHRRLAATLEALSLDWELVLVDDASDDGTPAAVRELAGRDARVRAHCLPVNGGQHAATAFGLRAARGDRLVTMDDDLQHAPESIPALLAALRPGIDVAIARFPASMHAAWRRVASRAVRRLMKGGRSADAITITSFKAFTCAGAQRLLDALPAQGCFYLGAVLLDVTARDAIVNVDVPHHRRVHGRSGYGLRTLLATAWVALRGGRRKPSV